MTSSVPLPSSGKERGIFVQALSEYSLGCQAPLLSPSCPFFQISDSGPWCLEECMDLLAEHRDESMEGIEIAGDFRVHRQRRRSRRKMSGPSRPFDAAEIRLADQEKPMEDWRPSALLSELRELSGPPIDIDETALSGRSVRVAIIAERLGEMGIDGERILRSVFTIDMAHSIVAMTAIPLLLGSQQDLTELPDGLPQLSDSWSAVLTGEGLSPSDWFDLAAERGPEWSHEQVLKIFRCASRVALWLGSLPLPELLVWASPSLDEFGGVSESPALVPTAHDQWVVDRFMHTYLEEWEYDSLLLEWQYQHGDEVAPCATTAMRERYVQAAGLATSIAWKAVKGGMTSRSTGMTASSFVKPAVKHLNSGRYSVAAAIFDACRIAVPEDATAHNNYGFCMLPIDPEAALVALDKAATLGMRLEGVNAANRMIALKQLGRAATALEIANRVALSTAWSQPMTGYLWAWESETPELVEFPDVRIYIAELAMQISQAAKDDIALRTWTKRHEELVASNS